MIADEELSFSPRVENGNTHFVLCLILFALRFRIYPCTFN